MRIPIDLKLAALAAAAAVPVGVATFPGAPSSAHGAGWRHWHIAQVNAVMLEQFNVTATQTNMNFGWTQDEDTVWDEYINYDSSTCYHSHFPGWTTRSCIAGSYKQADGHGPGQEEVHFDMWGDYDNATGPSYEQHVEFGQTNDTIGGDRGYKYSCTLSRGSRPVSWDHQCSLAHYLGG